MTGNKYQLNISQTDKKKQQETSCRPPAGGSASHKTFTPAYSTRMLSTDLPGVYSAGEVPDPPAGGRHDVAFLKIARIAVFISLLLCLGCSRQPKASVVKAALVDSGRSVKFTGLNYAIVSELSRDTSKRIWQALIPVFRMPADTDLKTYQPVQPGIYKLVDSAIVFTPDTPFVKGHTYFMRYYRFSGNDNMWDYIRGKSKLGRVPYTDMVFK